MNHLIVGFGEIGKAVKEVIGGEVFIHDVKHHNYRISNVIDVMHVCFPYSDTFVQDVEDYITRHEPAHVVIYSTLPIGTTRQISGAVHSPIEGRHPDLDLSIRAMTRWLGANDIEEEAFFVEFFEDIGLEVHPVGNSDFTEFLKLRSTSKYGINIIWTAYEKTVADKIGMDFELIRQFDRNYNDLYKELGLDDYQRYILDPPKGPIGGHCVVPNAELLNEQYPSNMLDMIKEYK